MKSILDDIYNQIREDLNYRVTWVMAIRVGINQFHEMCKEEARLGYYPHIHNDKTFMGIPVWPSKIESIKIIWGQ